MIQVEGVSKRYGPHQAVRNISFEVERGEIVGFLGPNGAGKTTTMRILTGFLPPTEGRAVVAGFDVMEQPIEVKKRTGYLPENPPVYPEMVVDEYLDFVARIKGIRGPEVAQRVDAALERTSIGHVRSKVIAKLSKGYRQRVGLAQALIHSPDVLILDEPTVGLDPKQIIEIRELIRSLSGEHTIMLSTHILSEVASTCHRIIILNQGQIEASDTPANLIARLQGGESVQLEVDGPAAEVAAKLQSVAGVDRVTRGSDVAGRPTFTVDSQRTADIRAELARAVVESGWGLYGVKATGMSLEDVFLKLTTTDPVAEGSEGEAEAAVAAEEN
ncbi:MAG: ATP-binding cassette domain-containing protein [Acidobacteria bacterium]|nr:ATP-binding cassette domain-containing protein [Acidobacteriota bacterium]